MQISWRTSVDELHDKNPGANGFLQRSDASMFLKPVVEVREEREEDKREEWWEKVEKETEWAVLIVCLFVVEEVTVG